MTSGLLRATAVLFTGSVAAHAVPLLLGPALTRVYSPETFGQFALLWAMATNVAVVACARYDHALPLERDDTQALDLLALCTAILTAVALLSVAASGALVAFGQGASYAWLTPAVVALAAVQALTLWATRAQRWQPLSLARLVQYGGGAMLQLGLGWWMGGVHGLCLGAVAAALMAAWLLARPAPPGGWVAMARVPMRALHAQAMKHRDFPLLNTPHAFLGALQDTLTLVAITAWTGDAAAGLWALSLRYLKAPATLVGGALSQTLYPRLVQAPDADSARRAVRRSMVALAAMAFPLLLALLVGGPALFTLLFGSAWEGAGELARALAPYIALHFIASPLAVTTMAWRAQAWALRLALVGQVAYFAGLLGGLALGGLTGAAWGLSASMLLYFAYYFWAIATWRNIAHESLA